MTDPASGLTVVTGGGGFLGEHVVRRLVMSSRAVRVLDTVEAPPWVAPLDVEYQRGDILDPDAVDRAMRGASSVVHAAFASPHAAPGTILAVNLDGTAQVLASAARHGVSSLVAISSTIVDRTIRRHPMARNAPVSRLDDYRRSRIEAERVLQRPPVDGPTVSIVRPKTFVGPGRVGGFGLVFRSVRAGQAVPLLGPGTIRYQLLDIRDLADFVGRLVSSPTAGTFHVGASLFGTVDEDLRQLIDHADTGARLRHLPTWAGRWALRGTELMALTPFAEWHHCMANGRDSVVDTTRARVDLGWEPRWSNSGSIIAAYDWFVASRAATSTHPIPWTHRALRRLASAVLR